MANYLRNRTKCCFTCRTVVTHKPIPSYILKDTVQALSQQLKAPGLDAEENTEIVSAADRATMWDAVFKPVSNRRWYVDEEDNGVRRCGSCGHEIEGRRCYNCDEQFSDISDTDSDQLSTDNSMMFPLPHPAFLEGRWPGEGSDDEDDLSDEDNEFYGHGRRWADDLDDDMDFDDEPDPYVRAIRRERNRNGILPQDFHFGFGQADLGDDSGDEGDSYGGSFIDDDDTGPERHFIRGYDFDGEDDEDGSEHSDDDAPRSDRSDTFVTDRHGRLTRIGGHQLAYSPSYAGS